MNRQQFNLGLDDDTPGHGPLPFASKCVIKEWSGVLVFLFCFSVCINPYFGTIAAVASHLERGVQLYGLQVEKKENEEYSSSLTISSKSCPL